MATEQAALTEPANAPEELARWAEMDRKREEALAVQAAYREQKTAECVQLCERIGEVLGLTKKAGRKIGPMLVELIEVSRESRFGGPMIPDSSAQWRRMRKAMNMSLKVSIADFKSMSKALDQRSRDSSIAV